MGSTTGNIRGQRNQSSSNGYKTLGSILASDSGNGAGSVRRIYTYCNRGANVQKCYQNIFNLQYGQYKNNQQWFLK